MTGDSSDNSLTEKITVYVHILTIILYIPRFGHDELLEALARLKVSSP